MSSFHSILCPVDFSEHSAQALRLAAGLAAQQRARLTVLTVADPLLVEAAAAAHYGGHFVEEESRRELERFVVSTVTSKARWTRPADLVVATGPPQDEILDCARRLSSDLIVMGTHGVGGYRKMLFGSVTERVLRHSTVPVMATPLRAEEIVTLSGEAPTFRISTVLAPVDFGPGTERQVRMAAALAADFGALLLFVHVVPELRALTRLTEAVASQAQTRLERIRSELTALASRTPAVKSDFHATLGAPANEIARVAVERHAGLIVMGLTGHGAATGRPGSVAYRVLGETPVPVLAIPPG